MVDATDLKSVGCLQPCRFESDLRHIPYHNIGMQGRGNLVKVFTFLVFLCFEKIRDLELQRDRDYELKTPNLKRKNKQRKTIALHSSFSILNKVDKVVHRPLLYFGGFKFGYCINCFLKQIFVFCFFCL